MGAIKLDDLPHYTYDDFVQWDGDWEIIYGIAYAMSPKPMIRHQEIAGDIYFAIKQQIKDCAKCKVLYEVDWKVSDDTVVAPDIVVVCADDIGSTYLTKTPTMVIEVLSSSTQKKDKTIKFELYQNNMVKYYLLIDVDTSSITAFVLDNNKYIEYLSNTFDFQDCNITLDTKKILN